MYHIQITQYHRPAGHKTYSLMQVPEEYETVAKKIIDGGWTFASEVLASGEIALYVESKSEDLTLTLADNASNIPEAMRRLITNASNRIDEIAAERTENSLQVHDEAGEE